MTRRLIPFLALLAFAPTSASAQSRAAVPCTTATADCTEWVALGGGLACSPRPEPGRMRVQRPKGEKGLDDEETTHAGADRTEAA